jgi:hypothetical protein
VQRLLQFEKPFTDDAGTAYIVHVYGHRVGSSWEGFLVFDRERDGRATITPVETKQPHAEGIIYWASALVARDLELALGRASRPHVQIPRGLVIDDRRGEVPRRVIDDRRGEQPRRASDN